MIGSCKVDEVRRNSDAQAGDALILTKSIGVGVYSAAIKKDALGERPATRRCSRRRRS